MALSLCLGWFNLHLSRAFILSNQHCYFKEPRRLPPTGAVDPNFRPFLSCKGWSEKKPISQDTESSRGLE